MAGNQIVIRKHGSLGYGKNKKPPPYIIKDSEGRQLSEIRETANDARDQRRR